MSFLDDIQKFWFLGKSCESPEAGAISQPTVKKP